MSITIYELCGADRRRLFSPHCWKARMALAHKGLEATSVPATFLEVPRIEDGAFKIVPVIRDGERIVADSFAIATYLEDAYPDRPTLFGGPGGKAMARFVERWSQATIHGYLGAAAVVDIHDTLGPDDQVYFRASREARFGRRLEEVAADREQKLPAFRAALEPLRATLAVQPFLGGSAPLFCDYIVFGAFQWARIVSTFQVLDPGDPIAGWFARCLDLHGGLGRSVPAAG